MSKQHTESYTLSDLTEALQYYNSDDGDVVQIGEDTKPLKWLIGQLWNCTDIMPGGLCADIGVPEGSHYSQGVRYMSLSDAEKRSWYLQMR